MGKSGAIGGIYSDCSLTSQQLQESNVLQVRLLSTANDSKLDEQVIGRWRRTNSNRLLLSHRSMPSTSIHKWQKEIRQKIENFISFPDPYVFI